jgi:hypothetical protein
MSRLSHDEFLAVKLDLTLSIWMQRVMLIDHSHESRLVERSRYTAQGVRIS